MNTFLTQRFFHVCTDRLAKGILLCWGAGLVSGVVLAFCNRSVFSSLMCSAVLQPGSIVGLLVSTVFPFALFAFAFCNRNKWIISSICFYKSFSHFFCAAAINLLMFPDICMLMTMFFWSFKYEQGQMKSAGTWLYSNVIVLIAINLFLYSWISPILLDIFRLK